MKTTKMNLKNLGVALKKSELRQIMAGSGGSRCNAVACPDHLFCHTKGCDVCVNISEETGLGMCF